MKVLSINAEHTKSPKHIAFNTDEDLTGDLIRCIEFGTVKVSGSGKLLIVQLQEDDSELFTSESVDALNDKLAAAVGELADLARKRQRILENIARQAGLSLA